MSFLVSNVLPLAIPLNSSRVLVAITPPVIRIPSTPLLRTIQAHLAVFRVSSDLLAVIIGPTLSLAARLAASRLPGMILRWVKGSITVGAARFDHTGGCRTARTQIKNLKSVEEPVPRPRRWLLYQLQNRRKCLRFK